MQKGNIGVTTENIFPIIKKFLYSDHEIFLRELVSNAVDATQKLNTLASIGEFKGELGDLTIHVELGKDTITISDHGIGLTAEEIEKYIKATEEKFGVKITDEDLRKAIKLHNETRRLQAELYEMQKGDEVYLKGSELIAVMMAGISMPLEDYNELLKELIAELKAQGPQYKPAIRLLYTGGHADSQEFFELLENQGGQIVVDNLGFGSRSSAVLIDEEKAPLDAIIDYYFDEMPAATRQMHTQDERLDRLGKLVEDYKVDGVISSRIYMCDMWAFEQYLMRGYLAEKGIPGLELEVDYVPDSQGQIRTRVQAFVESLKSQKNL